MPKAFPFQTQIIVAPMGLIMISLKFCKRHVVTVITIKINQTKEYYTHTKNIVIYRLTTGAVKNCC